MKRYFSLQEIFAFTTFLLFSSFVAAQSSGVEKKMFGMQAGFLGYWGYSEFRITEMTSIRGEVGLDVPVFSETYLDRTGFILSPVLNLEPRWYYNLKKRDKKSKDISGNSGNFFSLKTSYHPKLFIVSDQNNNNYIPSIYIIPTWGLRRAIGDHFDYEAGLGAGYTFLFPINEDDDKEELAFNLHLRIGYRF